MLTKADTDFLWRALELAKRGEGHTRPNPPVGAVIVKNGKIIGEGWHKRCGGDHAEVAAIKDALGKSGEAESFPLQNKDVSSSSRSGKDSASPLRGATIYVTLEPCSKPGRVGACTDAIVAAGIGRVVFAVPDPNPTNRGRARRVLAKAGVDCRCLATDRSVMRRDQPTNDSAWLRDLVKAAQQLIAPFAKHVKTGLPFVTVKLAMSLDGKICDDFGNARWVSSAASRRLTGEYRTRVDAIMVGAETVRKDNPSLLPHGSRNDDLIRVVVSRSGRLPKKAQVFTDGKNATLVYRDAKKALEDLGRRGCLHVLCEGGLGLARSLADQGLVDAWHLITAPIVIGSRPIAEACRFKVESAGFSDLAAGDRDALYMI